VLIARGRDAADVPFLRSFGEHELTGFEVIHPGPARRPVGSTLAAETAFSPTASIQWLQSNGFNQPADQKVAG